MNKHAKNKLLGYEVVKKIHLVKENFQSYGIITETFKL